MDIFGFKKKKAEKEAILKETEKQSISKIQKVKDEYKILKDRAQAEADEQNESDKKWVSWINDKCPKCGSTNVNDRIRRIQGDGSFSGSMSGGLFYTHGEISGHSHLDTNPVNKCECGHEWKKRETDWIGPSSMMEKRYDQLRWILEEYRKASKAKLDPNNLNENFSTKEEKIIFLISEIDKGGRREWLKKFFGGISDSSILAIAEKEIWKNSWNRDDLGDLKKYWDLKLLHEKLDIVI